MKSQKPQPFTSFGLALKSLREKYNKSYAEVSGAVEIAEKSLQNFEAGVQRPAEDVLLLLIQHFNLQNQEAQELWRLAGYEVAGFDDARYFINDDIGSAKEIVSAISVSDMRIVYTDMIQVMVNNYGVILNFMQGAASSNQPLAVARVGMSKEHARSIIEVLKKTLEQADNISNSQKTIKQLSSGKKTKD